MKRDDTQVQGWKVSTETLESLNGPRFRYTTEKLGSDVDRIRKNDRVLNSYFPGKWSFCTYMSFTTNVKILQVLGKRSPWNIFPQDENSPNQWVRNYNDRRPMVLSKKGSVTVQHNGRRGRYYDPLRVVIRGTRSPTLKPKGLLIWRGILCLDLPYLVKEPNVSTLIEINRRIRGPSVELTGRGTYKTWGLRNGRQNDHYYIIRSLSRRSLKLGLFPQTLTNIKKLVIGGDNLPGREIR